MGANTAVRTGKNAAALFAGTLAKMIASFAFVIFAAAKMGLNDFGKYSLAIFYFELFLSLTATAVGILLTRDLARWKRRSGDLLASASIMALGLAVIAPVFMFAGSWTLNYSPDTASAILIASLVLLPASLCVVLEAALVAFERAEFVTIGNVVESLIRIPLSVAVLVGGFGWLGIMWVLLLSRVIMLFFYIWAIRKVDSPRLRLRRSSLRRFAYRWRVFAAENWMATMYTSLDVLVLSYIGGEIAVGIYTAAWKVVGLGSIFSKSYTTAIFPVMARLHGKSKDSFGRLYRSTIRIMALIAIPAVVGICILSGDVIRILYTDEFTECTAVLRVLVWALLVEFLNPFLSHALFAQGKQNKSMQVAAISLAVNSVLTGLLVYHFGVIGAAVGTVLGGLVATICYSCFLMPKKDLITTGTVFAQVAAAAAGLGVTLWIAQGQPLPVKIVSASIVYGILLFAAGAVRVKDFHHAKLLVLSRATT